MNYRRVILFIFPVFVLVCFFILYSFRSVFLSPYNIYSSLLVSDSNIDAKIIAKNLGINVSSNVISLERYNAKMLENKTLYSNKRALIKLKGIEVGTYRTKAKIIDIHDGLNRRSITYELYNISQYFLISKKDGNIKIKITDSKGKPLSFEKIKVINNLGEEWRSNPLWVQEVKKDLARKGIKVRGLEDLFYEETLPSEGWHIILYKIEDIKNVSLPLRVTISSKPQYAFKFFYFDPFYVGWWNESWEYRSIYFLHNNNNYDISDYPIFIKLNSTNFPWDLAKTDLSDIRVTQFNETQQKEYEIPYFLEYVNYENKIAYLWIRAQNFTANSTITIFIYHSNPDAVDNSNLSAVASFSDDFESGSLDTTKWTVVDGATVETDPVYGNGMMRVDGGNQITGACTSTYNVPDNSIIGYYARPESTGDWDSGVSVGDIYFVSDTGSYGAPPVISSGWAYPSGSQGPDTSYHFYRIYVSDGYQEMRDYTSGGETTNALSYTPGSLCTITDSDDSGRDALYDVIYVMELPDNDTSVIYNSTEYIGSYNATITHPLNNEIVYRYESFDLNTTLEARGFDLYDNGTETLTDYNDFVRYDYVENISIVDTKEKDYLELENINPWYPAYMDWQYRVPINISNSNSQDLIDFQVNITINTASLISQGKMNNNCSDIRFTYYNASDDSEKPIPYWIESGFVDANGCNSNHTVIWLKIPELKANSNITIYMYYGNPSAKSESNGDDVFIFFDDFEDLYQDPNKWYNDSDTTEEYDSNYNTGVMRTQGGNQIEGSCSVPSIPSNVFVDFWMRSESTDDFDSGWKIGNIYFISDSGTGEQCIGTGWCYPSGSQTDTTFHHYRITLLDGSQSIIDLNNGYNTSASLTYSSGSICSECDSDSDLRDVFYDLIYIRKYAPSMTFLQYNGSEEENEVIYYKNGIYKITIDFFSASVNYTNISYTADMPINTNVSVFVRTSPDKKSWSKWYFIKNATYPNLPGDRYLQLMIQMNTTDNKTSPKLYAVNISYERVKNSPYAWSQYYSVLTPIKELIWDTYNDFNNYTSIENMSIGYDGSLYLKNGTWIYGLYKYRMPINISNPNSQLLEDFQINIVIDTASLISQDKMNPDCSDIRFTYYNITDHKEYNVSYWIESGCNTSSTSIWVKIPYIYTSADTELFMYYGNPSVKSESDPYKVFDFYDDFEEGIIDSNKWSGGNTQIVYDNAYNTYAAEVATGNQIQGICTLQVFDPPFIVESHLRPTTTGDFDSGWLINDIYFITDTSGTGSPGISQGSWVYPSGSQGPDTSYHFYRIELEDGNQVFTDLTNGQSASATYTYSPGSICFVNDGDGNAASRYDDIRVRKLAPDMNFGITIGNEERYNSTYPSGEYISNVIDLKTDEYEFGKFYWYGYHDPNADSKFYLRVSSDGNVWSSWYLMANDTFIEAPSKRYIQWKVDIINNDKGVSEVIDKIKVQYAIETPGFVIMAPDSIFSTSNPKTCPLEEVKENPTSRECNITWNVIPKQEGNYTLRVKVNSTNQYMEDAYSQNVNISVFIKTSVSDLTITPSVQGQGRNITIKARLLDDLGNPISNHNITFYDATTGKYYGIALTDSQGYATLNYQIPKDEVLGYHTVYAIFNRSWPEFLEGSNLSTQYKVSSVPQINNLEAIPYWQGNNQTIRLRANITDKVGIDNVKIYVLNSSGKVIVNGVEMSYVGNDIYEYNFSSWSADTFSFYVVATNIDNIQNESSIKNFIVDIRAEMDIKTQKNQYKNFEKVYLDTYSGDWFNTSWKYRLPIEVYNPNDEDIFYDVINLSVDTASLISQGKMNPDCSDIRMAVKQNIYVVEINITNDNAVSYTNRPVKITISDQNIVNNLNNDGSDIRFFESKVEDPYSNNTFLPYWVENIDKETGEAVVWVKVPSLEAHETKTLYLYYGNKNALNKQNYSAVFDQVIGESRTYTLDSNLKTINFLRTYSKIPIVISSLNSYNEPNQSFVRITSVSNTNFSALIQESSGLDGVHGVENASYVALLPGQWLIGGKYVEVGTANVNSSYVTVYFQHVFSSNPIVLSQILTNNEADPAHTRENNINTGSFDVKIEETTDTTHATETVGYVAFLPFSLSVSSFAWESGIKNHDQPDADTWFWYSLHLFTNIPTVVAKIMSENGGDNVHERIKDVSPYGFYYKMEEEYGYDGAHIAEDNGYLAITNKSLIYGLPYDDYSLPITIGNIEVVSSQYVEIPFWLEEGCNTHNTTLWIQIPSLSSKSSSLVYMYYGNPSANDVSNKELTFSYPFKKSFYYVLDGDIASGDLQVSPYYNSTSYSINDYDTTSNVGDVDVIPSSYFSIGDILKSDKPLATTTLISGDGDALTPKIAMGKEFMLYSIRGTDYFTFRAFYDNTKVEIYNVTSGVYSLVKSFILSNGQSVEYVYDFDDGQSIYINATEPILLHRRAESNYDLFTVFPPSKEWYGVPSQNIAIVALHDNTNVEIFRSDQSSPTTVFLAHAGDSYTAGGLGSQGDAPAFHIKANDSIYVMAWADGDGTEATTFLPKEELDWEYVIPADAEYVAISTRDAVATCKLEDAYGNVITTQASMYTSTESDYPGWVKFNNVNKTQRIVCDSPFFAYFERGTDYETNLYGIKAFRNMFRYHLDVRFREEEDVYNNLKNNANVTLKGHLLIYIEKETSSGWDPVTVPFLVNDYNTGTIRVLNPGDSLNLTYIFNNQVGGWDTSSNSPGKYRVTALFTGDSANDIIKDSYGVLMERHYEFEIIPSQLEVTSIDHENLNKAGVREYEIGDNISWVNVSVKAINNTAINAKVELDLVKSDKTYAGFGPLNEVYDCGNIPEGSICNAIYDNSSHGYLIPLDTSGVYIFYWNVTMTLDNGNTKYNGSEYIVVHDVKSTASSSLNPTRIYKGQDKAAYYNFSFHNLWSLPLTNVNVTINCNDTLDCKCALPGQENNSYCYLGSVSSDTIAYANFTVNYTSSTPQADYIINATLSYENPGNESKRWEELAPQTLEVRYEGILAITPYSYPSRVVRGEGGYNLSAYINNTGSQNATNAWLNYSLPDGWIVWQGSAASKTSILPPYNIFWNNISVNITSSASLGSNTLTLTSASDQGQEDFKNLQVEVWARPQIVEVWLNDTNASVGESVKIRVRLLDDLGNPVSGEELRFYDDTDDVLIGTPLTDSQGYAEVIYDLSSVSLGIHTINISHFENSQSYLLYAENTTLLDVGLKPQINKLWHDPYEISYGGNISIYANVTDDDGIKYVTLYVQYPNGSTFSYNMTHLYGDIYNYNLTDLWDYGTYSYYVKAVDIVDSSQTSSHESFKLTSYAQVYVSLDNDTYPPNTNVYLTTYRGDWIYKDRYYKKEFNIKNNYPFDLNDSLVLVIINTTKLINEDKLDENCENLAFSYYNATLGKEEKVRHYVVKGSCNHNDTYVYVEVPKIPANSNISIYAYYDAHEKIKKYIYDEINISTYNKNITIHYPLSSTNAGNDAYAISFKNGYLNTPTSTYMLATGTPTLIPATDLQQDTPISHDTPVFIASTAGHGDAFPVIAYAGKRFVYRFDRGTDVFYIYAPWSNASCNIYNSTTLVSSFIVNKSSIYTANVDITDGDVGILECDAPVLAFHDATGEDTYIMYPASKEWYGVASNYLMIAALEDNTHVNIYKSTGDVTSLILNRGESYREVGLGSQGAGPAVYVKADKPIGVNSIADGDGTEGTTFLPPWELSSEYYLPLDYEYIAVAAPYSYTRCEIRKGDAIIDSMSVGSLSNNLPGKMLFSSGSAGYSLVCNNSVFAYYEPSATNGEQNLLGPLSNRLGYGYNATTVYEGEEISQGAAIINHGNTSMEFYIKAYVEKNSSSGWQPVETEIDDLSSSHIRYLAPDDSLDLSELWNSSPFNTDLYPKGTYRVKVDMLDKYGNIIGSYYTPYVYGYKLFNISTGELKLNITSIRVYNVTGALNAHTSVLDLEKEGINDTFIMYVGEVYRIEVDVNVSSTSDIWWINTTNVTYENFNSSSWIIRYGDIWYMNSTDTNERVGGSFSSDGVLRWNTTDLDGKEDPGGKVTFYFILNLTNATPQEKQVVFKIVGNGVGEQDYSTFKILRFDNKPPILYRNTYGTNVSYVIRGDALKVYARWVEEISNAIVEYNSTKSILVNYTISLPDPNPYNWTNYSVVTTSSWLLGNHAFKIYAEDLSGNMNSTLPYLYVPVYGLAYISEGNINNTEPVVGDYINITCKVMDGTISPPVAIEGYPVSFYNDTSLLGIAYTNSSGYATFVYHDLTPGYETIKCNISDNTTMYYLADKSRDEKSFTIFTKELVPPYYTNESEKYNLIHKGDTNIFRVYWHDNFQLDYAILEMNDSGSFKNNSLLYLNHLSNAWSNFSYTYPTSYSPGYVAWRVYANDTSGNINYTNLLTFEVWGWAKLDSITLSPSSMYVGNSTIISCKVIDANSTSPLSDYKVYFYNSTNLLGINYTDANGIAIWNYTDYSAGKETITCEIRDNATIMYNASRPYNLSATLNTVISGDAIPPKIVNNMYGLNVSYSDKVFRNETILLYGLWDEAINYSWREIKDPDDNKYYTYIPGHVNNWTNHTIPLDYSWKVGTYYVKLYANDTAGNVNDTLPYLNFTIWGLSRVNWISPQDGEEVNRSTIYLITNVTDYDTGNCIFGYKVSYYDNVTEEYYLGYAYVGTGCIANFTWDSSNTEVGYHELKAVIEEDSDAHYVPAKDQDVIVIIIVIVGALNTTIVSPEDGAKLYRGQTYWFNSTTYDDTNTFVHPDEVDWYINDSLISTKENFSYTIPIDASLGIREVKAYSKAPYYQRGEDIIHVDYWSKANITMINPSTGDTVYVNNTVPIKCNVSDYIAGRGIDGYKVDFYVENLTYQEYLGYAYTDANGIAIMDWYVNSSKYVVGNRYDVKCSISSNSTLRYDPNVASAKANVYVNETTGYLEVNLTFPHPDVRTYIPKNQNFYINATVTCRLGVCGDVNATAIYNGDNVISTVIGSQPFYINDGKGNPRLCMQDMQPDDTCNVSFLVNATGDYGSIWNISVWFNSSIDKVHNATRNAEVFVGYVLLLSVEPSNISYWYLPPSDPTQSYISPPVTLVDPSTSIIKAANTTEIKLLPGSADANGGLWIKGENLTSPTTTSVIPVWNITRCLGRVEDFPTPQDAFACWNTQSNKLSYNYTQILSSMVAGDWINLTLFLDVPPVYAGKYSGNIWVMVNASY